MGLFGKILSTPFKVVNAPIRALEDLMGTETTPEDERFFSKPLDELAKQLEKVDE
jgi:hypothetical protein